MKIIYGSKNGKKTIGFEGVGHLSWDEDSYHFDVYRLNEEEFEKFLKGYYDGQYSKFERKCDKCSNKFDGKIFLIVVNEYPELELCNPCFIRRWWKKNILLK